MTKLQAGAHFPALVLTSITGEAIKIPDPEGVIHLQFRRYAGCPICNLHLQSVAARHDEISAAGIGEVVVFHSKRAKLLKYDSHFPFAVIADPDRTLYTRFGVELSAKSLATPGALRAATKGMLSANPLGALGLGETHIGRPADFLIDPNGTVVAAKYGVDAYDQWSVDEILALAQSTQHSG